MASFVDAVVERLAPLLAPKPEPYLVDSHAAGELLGMKATWVREQARRDAIPWVPMGRYVMFDPVALREWASARGRGPKARTGSKPVSKLREAA